MDPAQHLGRQTHTDEDGYTTYTPGNGVRVTSGMGDTVTVSCRGGNDECFAEASRRCPYGYEAVHGPSPAAGPQPVLFAGDDDDNDDWGSAQVDEMRVTCQKPGDSEAISESIHAKQLADKRGQGRLKGTPLD